MKRVFREEAQKDEEQEISLKEFESMKPFETEPLNCSSKLQHLLGPLLSNSTLTTSREALHQFNDSNLEELHEHFGKYPARSMEEYNHRDRLFNHIFVHSFSDFLSSQAVYPGLPCTSLPSIKGKESAD